MDTHTTFSPAKHCVYCHKSLTSTESLVGDVCNSAQCRLNWQVEKLRSIQNDLQQKLAQDIAFEEKVYMHQQVLARETSDPELASATLGVVPAIDAQITQLPEQRVEKFRKHLEKCIDDALEIEDSENIDPLFNRRETDSLSNAVSDLERDVMRQACSTCRGYCCQGGGRRHAYQDIYNMHGFIHRNPGLTPDDIIAQYIRYAPEKSVADSCIFHTETGCALPRDMRAEICNRVLCKGLQRLKRKLKQDGPDTVFIVGQMNYHTSRNILMGKFIDSREIHIALTD